MARKLNQYKGELTPAQIAEGMNSARNNAARLASDARLLFLAERIPSAVALALLSIEESGKLHILRVLSTASNELERARCWKDYRSHTKKNAFGPFLELVKQGARRLDAFRPLVMPDAEHPALLDQLKQLAIYTDFIADGQLSEPVGAVSREFTEELLLTAELFSKGRSVTGLEIEIWVKHMQPVQHGPFEWQKQALVKWAEEMRENGIEVGDMASFVS